MARGAAGAAGAADDAGDAPTEAREEAAARWGGALAAAMPGAHLLEHYDGIPVRQLADALPWREAPLLVANEIPSTQDAVHRLAAAGAPAGTIVVAERQTAGRGRHGRDWRSAAGGGVWLTLLDRPASAEALGVLSLRLGLRVAAALEPLAGERTLVKWPNDVYVAAGKVAGILVEARWRDDRPEWVAIGVGVNVRPPDDTAGGAGLGAGATRAAVLRAVATTLRTMPDAPSGARLTVAELRAWASRDLAAGRRCTEPVRGTVLGITADGLLRVRDDEGTERQVRAGSLRFAAGPTPGGDACCS